MGQQDHSYPTSSHYWSTIMRSSRSKMFLYIVVLCAMCVVLFLLSSLHSNMKDLENSGEKCQQQRDSLSAQLQVLYEHKSRLDKSLQEEKSDHKRTKEENERLHQELEVKNKQEKTNIQDLTKLEKELLEVKAGFSHLEDDKKLGEATMKDQYQALQSQKDGEIEKLQAQVSDLLAEKGKLEQSISDNEWKVKQHVHECNLLQIQYDQMKSELAKANSHLQKLQNENKVGLTFPRIGLPTNNNSENSIANGILDGGGLVKSEKSEKKQNFSQTVSHKDQPPSLPRPNIHLPSGNIVNSIINNSLDPQKNVDDNQYEKEHVKPLPVANGASDPTKNNTDTLSHKVNDKGGESLKLSDDENENPISQGVENNNMPLGVALGELNHVEKTNSREIYNLPQVQPPNNFESAGEQGELVNMLHQPAVNGHKQQLEKPDYRDLNKEHQISNNLRNNKNVMPAPPLGNDIAPPQQQDVLDKPGDVDLGHHNHFRAQREFVRQYNLNRFNGDTHLNGGVDGHPNAVGRQYMVDEDDAEDGENEDEQIMGGQIAKGKAFQDNDFEDQENIENNDNAAKDVEGVMVAPK